MDAQTVLARITANGFPMSDKGDLAGHLTAHGLLRPDQAPRAVAEYARFLALLAVDPKVQPAPVVDEVWQEHLKDTAAYLEQFCQPVFGRTLHRRPGRQALVTDEAYRATLATYRAAFGAEPPSDIWPTPGRMGSLRL